MTQLIREYLGSDGRTAYLDRRSTILLGLAASVAGTRSWAQDDSRFISMQKAFEISRQVREFAVNANLEEIDSVIYQFIDFETASRKETLAIMEGLGFFQTVETAKQYVASISEVLPSDFPVNYDEQVIASIDVVIDEIASQGLPLAPDPADVVPLPVVSVPPEEPTVDNDFVVIVDIILETLGISVGGDSLAVQIIDSSPEIKSAVEKLLTAASSKDWEGVAELAEEIFKLFVSSRVGAVILKEGARKLSFRLALRAVPGVGWIYCAAAFLISLKKNYKRFSFA